MYCPKCGKENPDDAQFCSFCNCELQAASSVVKEITVKTSRLAIASFILALASVFIFYFIFYIARSVRGRDLNLIILTVWLIVSWAAVILGVISLIQIGLSAGRLVATGFAVIGAVLPFSIYAILMLIAVFRPTRMISYAHRMVCGSNLSVIGKAMLIYANDYEDQFPRAGGPMSKWGYTLNWQAADRFGAYNLSTDGSGCQASISSSLYLLLKYEYVVDRQPNYTAPKFFVCKQDSGTSEFKPSKYGVRDKDLTDLWDFGPEPWKHCSYSYHIPYGPYALTTSNLPGMAVAADRNPWIATPSTEAKDFTLFQPDLPPQFNGTTKQARHGNTISHKGDGQNALFVDTHVDFEMRPYCGIEDDNIYTFLQRGAGHPQRGEPPVPFVSQPGHRKDSFLVHDPPPADQK